MINLVFTDADGVTVGTEYEVHPRSQEAPVRIPEGAVNVAVYLGTTEPQARRIPAAGGVGE